LNDLNKIFKEILDVYSSDEAGIPNSIEILNYNNNIDYLIIGLRNGVLLVMEIENNNNEIFLKNTFTKQIGNIPVKLCKNIFYDNNNQYIIVTTENTYKLYLNEFGVTLTTVLIPTVIDLI